MASRLESLIAPKSEYNHYNQNTQELKSLDTAAEIFEKAQKNLITTLQNTTKADVEQTVTSSPSIASAKVDSLAQSIPPFDTLPKDSGVDLQAPHDAYEEKVRSCLKCSFKKEDIQVLIDSIPDNIQLWPDTLRMLRESCYLAAYYYKSYGHLAILFPLFLRINDKQGDSAKKMLNAIFTHLVKNVLDPTLKRQGLKFFLRDDIYPYISDQQALLNEIETFLLVGDPLKLQLFHHQGDWDQEVWEQWINDPNLNGDQKFNLLIDPKAKSFVEPDKILALIQTKTIPPNCLLQFLEHLKISYQHDICLALIIKLKQSKYPIVVCHKFLAYLSKLATPEILQPELVVSLKALLQGMQKKSKLALKDTVDCIVPLVEKMPAADRASFTTFYYNLLPFSFEEEYYTSNQRNSLKILAQVNACVCSFSNYLYLKDDATIDLDRMVKGQFFVGDKHAAKYIVEKLSKLPDSYSYFERSYPEAFCNLYLNEKTSGLTYEEFIKALEPIDNPQKKNLYAYYIIQNVIHTEINTCLKYLEEFIYENQMHTVKHILSTKNLSLLVSSKKSSNALGNIVENFILQFFKNLDSQDTLMMETSCCVIDSVLHWHGRRISNFESFIQKLSECLAAKIADAPHGELESFFLIIIEPIINKCAELRKNSSTQYVKFPLDLIEQLLRSYGSRKDIYHWYFYLMQTAINVIERNYVGLDRVKEMGALAKVYNKLLALEPYEEAIFPITECCIIKRVLNYVAKHPSLVTVFSDSLWSATIKWFTYASQEKITIKHLSGFVLLMSEFMCMPPVVNKNFIFLVGHIERYTKLMPHFQFSNIEATELDNIVVMVHNIISCALTDLTKAQVCLPNIEKICQLIQPACEKNAYAELLDLLNTLKYEIKNPFKITIKKD